MIRAGRQALEHGDAARVDSDGTLAAGGIGERHLCADESSARRVEHRDPDRRNRRRRLRGALDDADGLRHQRDEQNPGVCVSLVHFAAFWNALALTFGLILKVSIVHASLAFPSMDTSIWCGSITPSTFL